eukprot:730204_1
MHSTHCLLSNSFSLIVGTKNKDKTDEFIDKANYVFSLKFVTDWHMDCRSTSATTLNFRTIASPVTKVWGKNKKFRKFKQGDAAKPNSIHLTTSGCIHIVINECFGIVSAIFLNHKMLLNKKRDWNTFKTLQFDMDKLDSIVDDVKEQVEDDKLPVLGDQQTLNNNWNKMWKDGLAKPGHVTKCKCGALVNPFGQHNHCIPQSEENPSPHSLLIKGIDEGRYRGRPISKKNKLKTLSELCLEHYYPSFVQLHTNIVIAYCKFILKRTERMGIELGNFCTLLMAKVIDVNDGVLCNDAEWSNIYMIIERFSGIRSSISDHNNNNNIQHTNEIILKLWIKQKCKVLLSCNDFCTVLKNAMCPLIEQTKKDKEDVKSDVIDEDMVDYQQSHDKEEASDDSDVEILEKNNNPNTNRKKDDRETTVRETVVSLENWMICKRSDGSPTIYRNLLNSTETFNKPLEITRLEGSFATYIDEYFRQHNYL